MFTFQQDINGAIGRYKDMVRAGEKRALRVAEDEPQPAVVGKVYRQVANWLNGQRANLGRMLTHTGVTPMHNQAAG